MANEAQQNPSGGNTPKKGGRRKTSTPKPKDDKSKKGKKGKDDVADEEKAEGDGKGKDAELLKKIEEALALKTVAHKKAQEWHFKHFCHLSPWIRLPLAMLVDLIDAVLGIIPGVDMAGTFLATCAAYILWGDMGFIAAWEMLPKLFDRLHLVHGGEAAKKSHFMGWLVTLTPTVTIVGIITIINEHRRGHVLCQSVKAGEDAATRPEVALVAHKREIDPAWRELGCLIKKRLSSDQYVYVREIDPNIRILWDKIKSVFKKLKFW